MIFSCPPARVAPLLVSRGSGPGNPKNRDANKSTDDRGPDPDDARSANANAAIAMGIGGTTEETSDHGAWSMPATDMYSSHRVSTVVAGQRAHGTCAVILVLWFLILLAAAS